MKRMFDVAVSVLALGILALPMAAIAALIKLGSPGPVFYRGVRAGRGGEPFRMLKFRTMVADAERVGGSSTPEDDRRITPVGALLRMYKLDELPQLLNVLRGEMSLVGPRPQVLDEVARYTTEERRLLEVRPGITDYASIRFRDEGAILKGQGDPHEAYVRLIRPEKMRLGLEYVRTQSFRTDLIIIGRTLAAVLGRGAAGGADRQS
jgi:lipopolysaccharide/colanic/teichoic acid biosynthesis glycosyltransferase